MKKQPMRATALVAAGVVSGGILAGTLGAQAANEADGDERRPHVRLHVAGPDGGGDLAEALGVSQERLREAMESIHDELRPDERPTGPPSKAEMQAMHEKFVEALASELGLSEATVKDALAEVRKEHRAEHREALSDRLDKAVKAGKLTSDDKASVLKAFDAGVLGGPGGAFVIHRAHARGAVN